ncbi:hypothetical protein BOTBODRAFT_119987 [Botryobasidium botryosum FD-172 SS1]|uniref:Uncharacterized protein n=1 Tax=Botryobasidium botryosum (strain FD-172 SS1) TaxID=930990 RepID=A0A067LYK9_BOTB1|nr:hypothetical protein BOTBODRAFT_119987 [Botryobasidium botryosum FD-172 SS1]
MIVTGDSKAFPPAKDDTVNPNPVLVNIDDAGPSTSTSITTAASNEVEALAEPSDPPPAFSTYEPEYDTQSNGDIVSHDPHLNQDGEALYRFLLAQAPRPPRLTLHCRGTHNESTTRLVPYQDNTGRTAYRTERETHTITDFSFYIDFTPYLATSEPVLWTVADGEAVHRGKMVREVDVGLGERREARRDEVSAQKRLEKHRSMHGVPPWVDPALSDTNNFPFATSDAERTMILRSSKSLRAWADDYCASDKNLREFNFQKVPQRSRYRANSLTSIPLIQSVYGWDLHRIRPILKPNIRTPYPSTITTTFSLSHSSISVRPSTALSRTLSRTWVKVLLWITLIYPFIWIYRRFHPRGGGVWEGVGGALPGYTPSASTSLTAASPSLSLSPSPSPFPSTSYAQSQLEFSRTQEGRWLRAWESTIARAVQVCTQAGENEPIGPPLLDPGSGPLVVGFVPTGLLF